MVAELTGIPITVSAKDKSSSKLSVVSLSSDTEVDSESHNKDKKKRPRWIRTATRDPIYTVLDDRDCSYTNKSNKCLEIAISAVKSQAIKEPEEPLYSVVKKPPKLIDAEVSQEKSRQEILSKQRELHKWLESSSAAKEQEMDEKPDDPWAAPGISVPRGVIGIVGPYGRAYTNPNEKREYMLEEELEEIEECPEDISTAVDSIDGRYRDKNNKSEYDDDKDSHIVKKEINRRPKWRVISEVDEQEIIKEITMDKETSLDNRDSDYIDDIYGDKPPKYFSKDNYDNANNEPHDRDSLNETGSTTGGTTEGNPGISRDKAGPSEPADTNQSAKPTSTTAPSRSLVSRILARARSPDDLLDQPEPYSQLWIVLSNVYGELLIVLMMALCLAEVMDTPVQLLSLQSIFLMYLYVGSIIVIISIYLWVLIDSCGNLSGSRDDIELGGTSLTRFGSLKKAHISRARTAPTSFYIRVGALLFGLATLVFNGLEMAMHSLMQGAECLNDIVFVHPALHGMFTFLQMHFLFVNSQVLVERFGLAARFGFIHLAATNVAVWARLVIWDSALEWTYFVHLAQRGQEKSSSLSLRGLSGSLSRHTRDILGHSSEYIIGKYQPISDEKIAQVVTLQECLNTNTLGQLWTSSMSFLYPFIVQFSLIAAAVTFVMGQNVGKNRFSHKQKFHSVKDLTGNTRVGCEGASKGLFLGILSMTAGIVVILIFLVVREDENFPPATLSWLTSGTLIGILSLSGVMTASGLVQVRQMSIVSRAPASLDNILSNVAIFGVQLYSIFTAVVCACFLATVDSEHETDSRGRHIMLLTASVLQLAQCFAQSTLIAEASKRSCITRFQMMTKPARQVVTFLLFSNAVLWAFDTVVTQNWISQEIQLRFFGVLAWGIISRICVPLLVFYRFHSCVLLLEIWNKCYRTPRGELPLN
ncbi:proton channel OtopLc isoform X1 [Microplitis demolitor]|uniref:proton channel OtopLc isoform X1 n=1 Tax=Microplitis demolitor TaxID=69319 RepID=UPI0004CD0ABA|nr:proton channel OtopLc isoform X1 [Microplitis demolitor]